MLQRLRLASSAKQVAAALTPANRGSPPQHGLEVGETGGIARETRWGPPAIHEASAEGIFGRALSSREGGSVGELGCALLAAVLLKAG